ncbi:glycosyltransferase [Lacticaseibacillus jixianensis]|uniref:Glycosyltransferase n=1 Tax=Lacticaseibacillus jixianensis TaxID=2486012 RepID=A0ABW4BAZ6_9LACO|nr:glycosyltransferase [Lacticaseibacillus jixianensis]
MNYFISENIFALNSGTEHAQARRVKVFAALPGEAALYVTRNYNRFLDRDRQTLGLRQDQVLNMYDYFQQATRFPRREQPLRGLAQIPLAAYKIQGFGPNYSLLLANGEPLARANIMPGTVGLVGDINYQDRSGHLLVRENFDWRGFKSSVDYFHPQGARARTVYLDPAGKPKLVVVCMNRGGQVAPTLVQLLDYHGKNYRFASEDELFQFFLDQLVAKDPQARLFCERRSLDRVVGAVAAKQKWVVFHDAHAVQGQLLAAYRAVLTEHPEQFTGVLVATKAQQAALMQQYPRVQAVVVPDTAAVPVRAPLADAPRPGHVLIMVGRLAPEKGVEAALRIFARVRAAVPDATLVLRGYAQSAAYLTQLKQQAAALKVAAAVTFAPYVTGSKLTQTYAGAHVLLAPSRHEGLGMQLIEALSAGTPVIAYDCEFGPASVVSPGVNGDLVRPGAEADAAAKVIKLLRSPILWRQLHRGALATASRYRPAEVGKQWQAFLKAHPVV